MGSTQLSTISLRSKNKKLDFKYIKLWVPKKLKMLLNILLITQFGVLLSAPSKLGDALTVGFSACMAEKYKLESTKHVISESQPWNAEPYPTISTETHLDECPTRGCKTTTNFKQIIDSEDIWTHTPLLKKINLKHYAYTKEKFQQDLSDFILEDVNDEVCGKDKPLFHLIKNERSHAYTMLVGSIKSIYSCIDDMNRRRNLQALEDIGRFSHNKFMQCDKIGRKDEL